MTIHFTKYQGTGNDFIMINNMSGEYSDLNLETISKLCDRRFGIGADGLIKINSHSTLDFEVDYYNADGTKSFCGNGARCSVHFAKKLGLFENEAHFMAIDGEHRAIITNEGTISLEMTDVQLIENRSGEYILNTGSPHYCSFVNDLNEIDIDSFGKSIRYSEGFNQFGINVNCIKVIGENAISILTYERGVEAETLSCGTGATACAIAYSERNKLKNNENISVKVKGGDLKISFKVNEDRTYSSIRLIGPAAAVFNGSIDA